MDSLDLNKQRFISDLEQLFDAIKETEKQKEDVQNKVIELQNLLEEEAYFGTQVESQIEAKDAEIQAIRQQFETTRRQHEELQWFFGEMNAKKELAEGAIRNMEQRCNEMEQEVNALRDERDSLRRDLDEAKWFLGEANAKIEQTVYAS